MREIVYLVPFKLLAKVFQIGYDIFGNLLLFILLGLWLDNRLSTKHIFLIAGVVLGVYNSFRALYNLGKNND